MREKPLLIFGIVFVVIFSLGGLLKLSYEEKSERLLDKFADPKANYAMLLSGYVSHEGDTVFFDLLPSVQFAIGMDEQDVIIVKKSSGEKKEFTRKMINMWGIPSPLGEGKAMTSWQRENKKEFFKTFEKVVKNGQVAYEYFGTKEELERNFVQTYHKSHKQAKKLAKKVMDPLFSARGMKSNKSGSNVIVSH